MTPAQASGQPDFVTDWPVQGPTDEGIRAADCRFAQDRLPAKPACVDCNGPVPPWARTAGLGGPIMETISFGGKGARGFALGGTGDPDIFDALNAAQVAWINNTLVKLNDQIVKASGTSCPTWTDPSAGPWKNAVGCFQIWWNANLASPKGPGKVMRTDGVVDSDTLAALQTVAAMHPADFPTGFPGPAPAMPPAAIEKKGLSTGAMVGIGVGGAAVLGGIVYAATRGGSKRRRR